MSQSLYLSLSLSLSLPLSLSLSCVRAHARSGVNAKACAMTISFLPFASFMNYFLINSLSPSQCFLINSTLSQLS